MHCDFDSARLEDGRWVHVCRQCGVTRFATTARYVRQCGPTPQGATRRQRQGLGDWFHLMFALMGLKSCGGCNRRRRWLNRLGWSLLRPGERREVRAELTPTRSDSIVES